MYEVVWDTTKFNNKAEWPTNGKQPFALSTGDETGYGQHADYVFGWKGNALQSAMDTSGCSKFPEHIGQRSGVLTDNLSVGAKCAQLKTQTIEKAKACSVKKVVQEDQDGCKLSLFFSARTPTTAGYADHQ